MSRRGSTPLTKGDSSRGAGVSSKVTIAFRNVAELNCSLLSSPTLLPLVSLIICLFSCNRINSLSFIIINIVKRLVFSIRFPKMWITFLQFYTACPQSGQGLADIHSQASGHACRIHGCKRAQSGTVESWMLHFSTTTCRNCENRNSNFASRPSPELAKR